MSPRPSGRVIATSSGADLIVQRTFHAAIEDVWTSVTEPDRTARWIGAWSGEAGPGKTVRLVLGFEQGAPACEVHIESCEPPRRLALSMRDSQGEWKLSLTLTAVGETTELTFVQHLSDPKLVGDTGPGWEYYLDMLVASREGKPLPAFTDYYPAQRTYYLDQVPS